MAARKWFDREKPLLVLLVLMAAAIRILFLLRFDNMPGDATGTVERALHILENPSLMLNYNGNSSTFYKYMIASFMVFWRDPILAPRFFTALFGIFLVIPYYGTLKEVFDRTIAFLSTLVLVFYPLHVVQSSVAASDAVFYFFLFCSLYYFFRFRNGQGSRTALWASALWFNGAALLRFESWIFIPIFFLFLWPKGKRDAFSFLALSVAAPCLCFLLNGMIHHDILYTFSAASKTASVEIKGGRVPYDPSFWSWVGVLWWSSGPSVVIGGFAGVVLAFLTRQKRALAVFFLVLFLSFTINTYVARMWHHQRYSILLALLLIPYAWFLVDRVLDFFKIKGKIFFALFLLFPAINFWQMPFMAMGSTLCFTPPAVKNIGLWLKHNVQPDETLIIDADLSNAYPANILLRSGIPPGRCLLLWRPTFEKARFRTQASFEGYLWNWRPKYLVLNSEGQLLTMLNWDPARRKFSSGNISFEIVREEDLPSLGKYLIYKVSYGKAPDGPKHG